MKNLSDKIIITAALAGNQSMKEHNPKVPYTPEEYAEDAHRCYEAGASIFHLHIRDPDPDSKSYGQSVADLDIIRPTLEAVKKAAPDAIINLSSSIAGNIAGDHRARAAPIKEFEPEMCSFNTNSMNFAMADYKKGRITSDAIFTNSFFMQKYIAKIARKARTKPEIEIFDFGGMYNTLWIHDYANWLDYAKPLHFQFVFGVLGGVPFTLMNLAHFLTLLPDGATWSVCGITRYQTRAAMVAVTQGGHIRVGLEDNVRNHRRELAKGSYEQVEWAAKVIELAGKDVAIPDEARKILGLPLPE